jgi:glycosyltransferase involved in cell wall biosynthesis
LIATLLQDTNSGKMFDGSPKSASVDVVVERQWHIGIHARALARFSALGTVVGGFPARRYVSQGVPAATIRPFPYPAIWNHFCSKASLPDFLRLNEPATLARFTSAHNLPSPFLCCYATAYRYLFPKFQHSNKILILERGSTHPELYFQQIEAARRDAGLPACTRLPDSVRSETEAGKLAHFIGSGSAMITESYTTRGYSRERILEVPWCTDEAFFAFQDRSHKSMDTPVRLLCVGVVGLRKGLWRLIQIARWAQNSKLPVEVVVVGPLESEAKELLVNAPDNLRCLGLRKGAALREEFYKADLYILPSYEEGFGISILEGMATGLPAIVSMETGGREAIEEGINGLVLSDFSTTTLEAKLLPLVRDQEQRLAMGRNARQTIIKHYTFTRYAAGIEKEYRRMFDLCAKTKSLSPAFHV